MIKKYNKFLNEKLSDKLRGFNEDELKQKFLSGKLNIYKYNLICKKNNLEKPTKDEIKISISNHNPNDMLYDAVYYNFLDLVELAFERGADIIKDTAILMKAVYNANIEIVKCLLKHNINVTEDDFKYVRNKEIKELLQKYYDKQNDKDV